MPRSHSCERQAGLHISYPDPHNTSYNLDVFSLKAGAYRAPEQFDAYQYLHHLRRRAGFILAVCAISAALALIVSLLLPKQFTATASIVIDPPAADDPRASVAVNPTYLESLKSYELLASSDTLFARASDRFHLQDHSMKKRVLKVSKLRDTKVLEISVTLHDPKQAQAMAEFLAAETVNLSRMASRDNDQDLLDSAQRQLDEAKVQLEREQKASMEWGVKEPLEGVRAELETLASLRKSLRQDLADARTEQAEFAGRAGVRERMESLQNQDAGLGREMDAKAAMLSRREAHADELEQRLHVAQGALNTAATRLSNLRASAGTRGERLHVMDPGVVPEQPTSPNLPLNAALALAAALAASLTYLTLTYRPSHD